MIRLGDGRVASTYLGDGTLLGEPSAPALGEVAFATWGLFEPTVELVAGSTAVVQWQDAAGTLLATGQAPSITVGGSLGAPVTVRMRVISPTGTRRYRDILTVNLGFTHTDDAGAYNIGPSYNRAPTHIVGVSGLGALTGMKRFLAARGELTGHLDLTGCAALEYVECYTAKVTSCTLTGCSSLIRLCLEACRVTHLDFNPVRGTLRDLRSADQGQLAGLTFAPLAGPMEQLYHFCVRDQQVHGLIPLGLMPAIEEYWCWNTGQSEMLSGAVSPVIRSLPLQGNGFDQASVDRIITSVADVSTQDWGGIDLTGSAAPSPTGTAAADVLRGRAWTVTTS